MLRGDSGLKFYGIGFALRRDDGAKGGNLTETALFSLGQIVHHKRFGYRGVIADVDAAFSLSEEWYEQVAKSRPPKDQPWYHVIVHESGHMTYVAQRHLEEDLSFEPIHSPLLGQFFHAFRDGRYHSEQDLN